MARESMMAEEVQQYLEKELRKKELEKVIERKLLNMEKKYNKKAISGKFIKRKHMKNYNYRKHDDILGGNSRQMFGGSTPQMFGGSTSQMFGGSSQQMFGGSSQQMFGGSSQQMFGGNPHQMFGGSTQQMYGGNMFGLGGSPYAQNMSPMRRNVRNRRLRSRNRKTQKKPGAMTGEMKKRVKNDKMLMQIYKKLKKQDKKKVDDSEFYHSSLPQYMISPSNTPEESKMLGIFAGDYFGPRAPYQIPGAPVQQYVPAM